MLNFDVGDVELLVMENQIHLTITGTVCAVVFGVVYWFYTAREALIAEEVAALRKITGLKSSEEKPSRQPIQLGPPSYRTLIFSVLSCTVTLAIIWLIKITPFERLYKCSPLYKLVKILFNSKELELEEDDAIPRGSPAQTARHQQILNTCIELEKRMARLEQCLNPLAKSLQALSDVIEGRRDSHMDHQESETPGKRQSQVMDLLGAHEDLQVPDCPDTPQLKSNSDSAITNRLNSRVKDLDFPDKAPPDAHFKDRFGFEVDNPEDTAVGGHFEEHPDHGS